MNKQRLEGFSDGVLAIAITLLVLDIRIPHVEYSHLFNALVEILPNIISYLISFAIVAVYWVGHHYYFKLVSKTDGVFTWLNILFLLFVSFIPFPTSLLGEYPFQTIPVLIYGVNLLLVNIVSFIMMLYIYYHRDLAVVSFDKKIKKEFVKIFTIFNLIYIIAIAISPFVPKVSYAIYIIAIFTLIIIYASRKDLTM